MQTEIKAYTITSFCRAYAIGRSLTYSEMAAGRLRFKKAGRRTIILKDDADYWLEHLPTGGPRDAS
jgi:hypothetical protein